MKDLLLAFLVLISINGCTALDYRGHQWVDGNMFFSTKLPEIEIKIEDSFGWLGEIDSERRVITEPGVSDANNVDTAIYLFEDKKKARRLVLKLESLMIQRGWEIEELDYSQFSDTLLSGKEMLSGRRFLTGVYAEKLGNCALLTKVYIKVFGGTVRFRIYYIEQVEAEWAKKSPESLTPKDRKFLEEFNIRAGVSFSTNTYSGVKPPI